MQPLAELTDCFRLYGVCIPCGRMEQLDLEALIGLLGGDATVTDVRSRLRCRQCGVRRSDLRVVYVGRDALSGSFSYRRN
jgi:hypothetical protein